MKLSKTEQLIYDFLLKNEIEKNSNKVIVESLNLSLKTVRNTIRNLKNKGMIESFPDMMDIRKVKYKAVQWR